MAYSSLALHYVENLEGLLAFSEEQRLRLAVAMIEVVRDTSSRTPVVISFDQPWAEYLAADDYDEAARVLLAIDRDYLWEWGQATRLFELHGRLRGKICARVSPGSAHGLTCAARPDILTGQFSIGGRSVRQTKASELITI